MKRAPAWVWALAMLAAVLAFNLAFTPGFFTIEIHDGRLFGSLIDVLNRAVPVALLSLGMTLVIATGGVDLSVGAVLAMSGAVAASLLARTEGSPLAWLNLGGSIPLVVLAALVVALACGVFNGVLVSVLGLQPIIATLLLMVAGRGIAQLVSNGQIVTFQEPSFQGISTGAWLHLPNPVWILLGLAVLIGLLTRATAFGLFIEATGTNPVAARYSGIDARRVKLAVYVISALLAGVAGIVTTADIQAADANNAGLYLELDAILAASVGGTALTGGRFSVAGALVGALLMQALTTTILTRGVPPEMTLVLKAAVVVLVCLLQAPSFRAIFRRGERSPA